MPSSKIGVILVELTIRLTLLDLSEVLQLYLTEHYVMHSLF